MCSSLSSSSLSLPSNAPLLFQHRFNFSFSANPFFIRPKNPRTFSVSASIAEKNSSVELNWVSWDKNTPDEYNGWAVIVEAAPKTIKEKSKGLPTALVIGIGASVIALLGFRFRLRIPFNALHGISVLSSIDEKNTASEKVSSDLSLEDQEMLEDSFEGVSEAVNDNMTTDTSHSTVKERSLERIVVPFAVDSTQQEALLMLKKLKITEDDAKAEQLCTRREYARWFFGANSQLERSRKHQINSSAALSGSTVTAFDDVSVQDPDFESIQSLAEAGIIRSKLSERSSSTSLNDLEGEGFINFCPERFISRQDLISWRAKVEYEVRPGITEEMSRKNIGFLDVREISSDVLVELFLDILSDEKSILRRVFGQSKRFQPSKPCTKAQAAVALTSGRMVEFIHAEILRLEAENSAKQTEMKEIVSELLERGEIKQYWERKMEEERRRHLEVERDYLSAITALEEEKIAQENALAEFLKQKAALDCQKQLLSSLNEEVTEMSERLASERTKHIDEQHVLQDMLGNLQVNYEGLLDTKSILEAEVEAIRILRSWIEDEARKSQIRAKVLEEAGRRWKWVNQS
ncbi:hypothetical protein Fot_15759 [Forsythia ovata]|uniref:SLH domain-containing protein n=1 Tax=Forsythia ovata TaxID=205694 RepID=A0ABD1WA33_9LAMI